MSYSQPPAYQGESKSLPGEPPLNQPYYGAPIGAAAKRFFKKYATFSGRASRSEFWWWTLIAGIVSIVLNIISQAAGGNTMSASGAMTMSGGATVVSVIAGIWALATIVPTLALAWRRLHDTNRSGAWYLLVFTLIGAIVLLVWFALEGKPEGQRFDR